MADLAALIAAALLATVSAAVLWRNLDFLTGKPKVGARKFVQTLKLQGPQNTLLAILALAALITAQVLYHRSGALSLLLCAAALCLLTALAFIGLQVQEHRDPDDS
ncbi:hypothetical protein [Deinococcus ficus]|uniref:DUF3784 domain-containing protein n=1 Tax=Deinococcus ficus TaxID=317577 RepID=A0A221T2L7_9DEIO|nr:hypothetical protein [Deinococcus ficus]ASN83167.1 hypothetical protein DFI_18375 [Deinococcus ficus]